MKTMALDGFFSFLSDSFWLFFSTCTYPAAFQCEVLCIKVATAHEEFVHDQQDLRSSSASRIRCENEIRTGLIETLPKSIRVLKFNSRSCFACTAIPKTAMCDDGQNPRQYEVKSGGLSCQGLSLCTAFITF